MTKNVVHVQTCLCGGSWAAKVLSGAGGRCTVLCHSPDSADLITTGAGAGLVSVTKVEPFSPSPTTPQITLPIQFPPPAQPSPAQPSPALHTPAQTIAVNGQAGLGWAGLGYTALAH